MTPPDFRALLSDVLSFINETMESESRAARMYQGGVCPTNAEDVREAVVEALASLATQEPARPLTPCDPDACADDCPGQPAASPRDGVLTVAEALIRPEVRSGAMRVYVVHADGSGETVWRVNGDEVQFFNYDDTWRDSAVEYHNLVEPCTLIPAAPATIVRGEP